MKNRRILSGNHTVEELEQMCSEQTDYLHLRLNDLSQSEINQFRRDSNYCFSTLDSIYKTERKIREIDELNKEEVGKSKTRQYFILGLSLVLLVVMFFMESTLQTYLLVMLMVGLYTVESNQKVSLTLTERMSKLFTLQTTFTLLLRDFISLFGTSYSLQNILGLNLVKEQEEVKSSTEYDKDLYEKIDVIQRIMSNEIKLSLLTRVHNFTDDKDFSRFEHMSYRIVDLNGYYNL